MRALGYLFFAGPELEFFLFDQQDSSALCPCDTQKYCQIESCTERDHQNRSLLHMLLSNGIQIEKLHHEVAPGQHEVSIKYTDALSIADTIVLTKHLIKSWAQQNKLIATFMPKPLPGYNGSGMHVHFSLYDMKKDKNAFYDEHDPSLLSDIAHHFIAGVLHYASELSAIFNPSINSYKRLVPGHEAPVYRCWSAKNRSAMIRIPQIDASQVAAARAEMRSPDSTSNPYLVLAGILKAGLEGIKQNMEIAPATDINLYRARLEDLEANTITILPTSLEQALALCKQSAFIGQLLGQHGMHEYIQAKEAEIMSFNRAITNWEIERYL